MTALPRLDNDAVVALRPAAIRPSTGNEPLHVLHEREAADRSGAVAEVLTVLLRGSECRFRCVMCDLWKSTHLEPTPKGSLTAQIRSAIGQHNAEARPEAPKWIKLYNASNFFAPANVPREELKPIASQLGAFERVIVENHPKLIHDSILRFRDAIGGTLEVAMGLETVHPQVLPALNKQMDLDDFQRACDWLHRRNIDVRTFVLLRPPGLSEEEGIQWCGRSIEFAQRAGVRHVSVIPLRAGNGAVEYLQKLGHFSPPLASSLEQVFDQAVPSAKSIVTVDLWDWERLRGTCVDCSAIRHSALQQANLRQTRRQPSSCPCDAKP